jgi:hypothetical protein
MRTYQELWENRDKILSHTRYFLQRVKNKKKKFTEQTRKRLNESGDTKDSLKSMGINPDEIKKIQWVLMNKFIPMLRTIGELQKDLDFLDSAKFGQWNIPKEELKEDKELLFKDKKVRVKTWKEGTSHPTSSVFGSPLEFTSYTIDGILQPSRRISFQDWVERRSNVNDFVWVRVDEKHGTTTVFVMKNPSSRGLEVNGSRPRGTSKKGGTRKRITEKDSQDTVGTEDRVDEFKPEPDDTIKDIIYPPGPLGKNRGYHDGVDQYIWNQLGTEKAKEELKKRVEMKYGKKYGGIWSDIYYIKELPKEGKTIVVNKWSYDAT